jgi:hypothetical protein
MLNKIRVAILILLALLVLAGCQTTGDSGFSGSGVQIDRDVNYALTNLYESNPTAKMLAKQAKGILVQGNRA